MDVSKKELVAENQLLKKRLSELEACSNNLIEHLSRIMLLADESFDWIYWLNPLNQIEYCSPSCEVITGLKPQEYINNPELLNEIVHSCDKELYRNHIKEIHQNLSGNHICDLHIKIVDKLGEEKHLHHICKPFYDIDGSYLGRLAVNRDVTQHKRQEEELMKSENMYKFLAENMIDVIWKLAPDFSITYISPSIYETSGYEPKEVIGRNLCEFLKDEYREKVALSAMNRYNTFKETGEFPPAIYETEVVKKDGTSYWAEVLSNPVLNNNNELIAYQGITRDISKRIVYIEELRKSKEKYQMLIETSNDFIWEIDANLQYTYISPYFKELLGYEPEDYISKSPYDLMPEDEQDKIKKELDEIIANNAEIRNLINVNIAKDGRKVYLETSALPFFDENGKFAGYRGIDRDVTHRIEYETKLKVVNEKLNSVIEVTNNGVWDWNLRTQKVIFNDKYYTMLGYEPDEFTGNYESWKKLLHPDDLEETLEKLNSHISNRLPQFEMDFRLKTKSGEWNWIKGTGKIIEWDSEGKPIRMLGVHSDIDRQKREQEEKLLLLSSAIKSASNGIVITDNKGIIEFANQAFLSLTGYEKDEVIGKNPSEIVNAKIQDKQFYKSLWATILSGDAWKGDLINRRKNGTLYTEEMVITPIFNDKNNLTNFIAIKSDVTEKKEITSKLAKSKAELQAIYDNTPVMICVLDENQRIVYANKQIRDYLNVPFDKLVSNRACGIFGCVNSFDDPLGCGFGKSCGSCNLNKAIEDTFMFGTNFENIEQKFVISYHGSTREVYFLASTALIQSDEQNLMFLCMLDISDRKKMEIALQNSESMFRAYVQNASMGIFVMNYDGIVVGANKEITKQLMIDESKLLSNHLSNYIRDVDCPKCVDSMINITLTSSFFDREYLIRRCDDSTFWAHLFAVNLEQGEILVFSQDISQRKFAQEEQQDLLEAIRIANEALEYALFQKNSLINELKEAQSALKETIAAKNKFFSIISHDLRGPFSGFLGLSDLLDQGIEEISMSDLKRIVKAISQSAQSVYQLLNDLLQWANTQICTIPFIPETQNLHEVVDNAYLSLKNLAENKKVAFQFDIEPTIEVKADRNMLTTVLRNLMLNSVKFSNTNQIVTVRAKRIDNFIMISVEDLGIGIPKKNLNDLLRIDRNFNRSGTNNEKGSGLGLLLCKEFVEQHKGTIHIESEEGNGTNVFFTIPI